jgi:signal transduction histidine kinase
LNNALRHGSPGLVEAHYAWRDDCLLVEICNDGVSTPPEHWVPGRGLHHIRHRAERLGASPHWSMRDKERVALVIELPLGDKR